MIPPAPRCRGRAGPPRGADGARGSGDGARHAPRPGWGGRPKGIARVPPQSASDPPRLGGPGAVRARPLPPAAPRAQECDRCRRCRYGHPATGQGSPGFPRPVSDLRRRGKPCAVRAPPVPPAAPGGGGALQAGSSGHRAGIAGFPRPVSDLRRRGKPCAVRARPVPPAAPAPRRAAGAGAAGRRDAVATCLAPVGRASHYHRPSKVTT